jgi:hypothetical protein
MKATIKLSANELFGIIDMTRLTIHENPGDDGKAFEQNFLGNLGRARPPSAEIVWKNLSRRLRRGDFSECARLVLAPCLPAAGELRTDPDQLSSLNFFL